jgi:UDP-N-acetylmuramoylalanine--D-glutamate ligase
MLNNSTTICIVGLGASGQSVAAYLAKRNIPFWVVDSREHPPEIEKFKLLYESNSLLKGLCLGKLDLDILCRPEVDILVVSPGVALSHPTIQAAKLQGKKIIGDIELFAQEVKKYCPQHKIIGITGSNGKSTVTTLVGELLTAYANASSTSNKLLNNLSKIKIIIAGNIGLPVLAALDNLIENEPDLSQVQIFFVLELSSFQLETTYTLKLDVACILNISANHLDRYTGLGHYAQAKQQIYKLAKKIVYNREDKLTYLNSLDNLDKNKISFGLDKPDNNQFGLISDNHQIFLACGSEKYVATNQLKLMGQHNYANILAALAIIQALGIKLSADLWPALCAFSGLPHRCEWVANINQIQWINDSKGTSIGAVSAAIEGLAPHVKGKIILIAGGDGKGADFSKITPVLEKYIGAVVLIGRDAGKIAKIIPNTISSHMAETIDKAVPMAHSLAKAGDTVLLSPICASWDQYPSFMARGEHFKACVHKLESPHPTPPSREREGEENQYSQ